MTMLVLAAATTSSSCLLILSLMEGNSVVSPSKASTFQAGITGPTSSKNITPLSSSSAGFVEINHFLPSDGLYSSSAGFVEISHFLPPDGLYSSSAGFVEINHSYLLMIYTHPQLMLLR